MDLFACPFLVSDIIVPGPGFGASDTACVDYGRDDGCSLYRAEESAEGRCCNKWLMVG